MPTVSLVIALYNQVQCTKPCLESIARCTPLHELILVDNGSTDGTKELLATVKGTVITNATNLGCAKAWNQGIRASKGDVVGILNNDIVVTPGWLDGLLAFMDRTGHALVSPAAREGPLDYDLDAYAKDYTRRCAGAVRTGDVYAPCMLIRREVFDRIGLFDEEFIKGGGEDIDFFWRMKAAGCSMGMTGSVLIHHIGMVTQDAIKKNESKAYVLENLAYFERKWQRTMRGNWWQRRWTDWGGAWRRRYERFRYGHTLVEKT
jgi:GT2 family glycosyltransferase